MPKIDNQRNIEIENRLTKVEESLDEVKTNHLPHLQSAIERIDARVWWLLGTVILGFLVSIALTLWK